MSQAVAERKARLSDDEFSSNPNDDSDVLSDPLQKTTAIIVESMIPAKRSALARTLITIFMIANVILVVLLLVHWSPPKKSDEEAIGGSPRNWCAFEETDVEVAPYFKYNGTLRKFHYRFASYARQESRKTHSLKWDLLNYELPFDLSKQNISSATVVVVHPLSEKKNYMIAVRFLYENLQDGPKFMIYYNTFVIEHEDAFIRNQVDDYIKKRHLDLNYLFQYEIINERDGKTLKLELHISRYPYKEGYTFVLGFRTKQLGIQSLVKKELPITDEIKQVFYILQFANHNTIAPWKATSESRCTLMKNDLPLCRDEGGKERFCDDDEP